MMFKRLLMSLLMIQGLATLYPVSAQAPVITSVQVNNPRSLTVTWTTIAASSGYIIYRYIPSASGSPTTGTLKNVTVAGTSNTSYTFSGLTPYDYTSNVGVTFALTVAAYFDLSILPTDFGDSSIVVTATLPLCPGVCDYRNHQNVVAICDIDLCDCNPAFRGPNCAEPTFVPLQVEFEASRILSGSEYALQVTWRNPEPDTLNGRLVDRYTLTLRNQSSTQSTIVLSDNTISASTNSYELTHLQSGANYSVEVATVSDVDQDPLAVISLNNPPFTVFTPGPVAMLTVQIIASNHIRVSWSPPIGSVNYHSLLQIMNYELYIVLGNTEVIIMSVFPSGISQVAYGIGANGLMMDTSYTAEISVRNEAGQGAVSSFIFTIPGLQCNDNQYGLPNATTCSNCPSNSISETGSTTISDCICLNFYTRLESGGTVTCFLACDLFTPLNNGGITYSNDSRAEGTMASYDCSPGYTLAGSQTRSCEGVISGGSLSVQWTGSQSSCVVTQCNPISEQGLNGSITYSTAVSAASTYERSTIATYNCSLGYIAVGDGVRTCLDGNSGTGFGEWSDSLVTCIEELRCTPLILVNGQVTYSQAVFTIGTVANYSCNTGFAILGILSLTCLLNTLPPVAYWSPGNRPVCIPIRCSELSTENLFGVIDYRPNFASSLKNYGTTALYTCSQGYRFNGTGMRVCTDSIVMDGVVTGVWSGDPVICEPILCPGLQAPMAGFLVYISPDGSEVAGIENGTVASYACAAGHRLEGVATLTCVVGLNVIEGLWTHSEPTCQPCPVGHFNPGNTSSSCLACEELHTTSGNGSLACDACRYSSPSSLGCYAFDTAVDLFEPMTNDVTVVAVEGTVRLTLRWPAVPVSVVDNGGNQVGQSVRIKINCATDEGITSSQYCTNDNTPLIADLNGISDLMYTVDLLGLVRYTFDFVIVASVNSNFADGPPGQSLSFTTPATNENDIRLPRILSISASPSGYVMEYAMHFQLPPILTSISSLYNSQPNPNTVYMGLQLSNDVMNIPGIGYLNATTLIAADQVVDFVLKTVVGLYVYHSPVYTLDPNIMPLNNIPPPSIVFIESTVLNSSSVLVVWSEAEAASSYGVVVNRVVEGGAISRVARITTTSLSLVVTMLTPSMTYTIRVASQDEAGFGGPLSSPFPFTLPEDLPGPPESVTLVVDGSFIDISWNPPSSPNGVITHYNVILTLLTGTTTFNTENLSFRLPKPDVAYSVGVQAVNSVGNGETIFALDTISTDAPTTGSPTMGELSMEVIIAIAAAGGGVLMLGLVLCLLFICCCCYYRRRSRNAFNLNTNFATKNMYFESEMEMEGVAPTKLERSMMSSSSLAPLPVRYTHQTTATDAGMYAEVNEMQMLKARETVKHATPFPYEAFLPKRDATPDDYNNEELYMEMGKIYYADINKTNILSAYEVDRSAIIIQSNLGSGQFGKVSQAKMKNVFPGKAESVVAVKMLKEGATDSARKDFLSEAQMLAAFDHSNVMGLLKVVTKSEPVLVIIPFMVNGDLKHYLKSMKKKLSVHGRDNQGAQFGVPKQLQIAEQIAGGMEYLAAKFFIHRDLAARNILVGEDNHCKIADFGLSRALAQEDTYYHVSEASLLPVKWMAIESLFYRKFSTYSDVWSFGIVLWEIFSYGAGPYKVVSSVDIPTHIQKGNRLECPEKCPAEVYEMMKSCWDEVKEKRGTFSQIKLRLKSITISLRRSKDKNQVEEDMYI